MCSYLLVGVVNLLVLAGLLGPTATPSSISSNKDIARVIANGDRLLQAGHAADALVLYREAALKTPARAGVQWRIAQACLLIGDVNAASVALDEMRRLKPNIASDFDYRLLRAKLDSLRGNGTHAEERQDAAVAEASKDLLGRVRACRLATPSRGPTAATVIGARGLSRTIFDPEELKRLARK